MKYGVSTKAAWIGSRRSDSTALNRMDCHDDRRSERGLRVEDFTEVENLD